MISLQTHTLEIFLLPSNVCICLSWNFLWKFFLWKTRLVMSLLLHFPWGRTGCYTGRKKKKKGYVLWHPLLSSGQFWFTKFNFNRRKRQFSLGTPRKGRGITFTKVLTCVGTRLHMPHVRWSPLWQHNYGYFVPPASVFRGIWLTCVFSGLGRTCWQLTLVHLIQA